MTLSFKQYINESSIAGSGKDMERHKSKYIDPHINAPGFTHALNREWGRLRPGSLVRLLSTEFKVVRGVNTLHVNAVDESGNHYLIPVGYLGKPGTKKENKGHDFENKTIDRLKSIGIMPAEIQGAGSTGGTDFVMIDKKKNKKYKGRATEAEKLNGETKLGLTAAFGQITIHFNETTGKWFVGDKAKNGTDKIQGHPKFAAAVEASGILEYLNEHHNPNKGVRETKSGRAETITMKHPNLNPAKAYLKDHKVDVLHVGSGYGTYGVGEATEHLGLPIIEGTGKWTIREKAAGQKLARTIMFQPDGVKGLKKSSVNIDNDADLLDLAKKLGVK